MPIPRNEIRTKLQEAGLGFLKGTRNRLRVISMKNVELTSEELDEIAHILWVLRNHSDKDWNFVIRTSPSRVSALIVLSEEK